MNSISSSIDEAQVDPLLDCLVHICQLEKTVVAASSLTAGLPLVDGKLSPELYVRAAQRAGLQSEIVTRQTDEISPLVLPAVAILKDNQAVVIEKIDEKKIIIFNPSDKSSTELSQQKFAESYSGIAIYSRPKDDVENRVESHIKNTDPHWFWSALSKSWRIYRDVLLASLMINIFVIANPLFVMNVYDRVVPNNAIETLWALSLGILVLYVFDLVLRLLRTYFIEVAGKKSDLILSGFILEKVLGAKYSEHPQSVGAFASKVREFETVRNFITSATVSTFVDLPFVFLFLLVIAYIGGAIVWVPVIAIPLILIYAWFVQRKLRVLVSKTFLASAQKNATLIEALSNLETLKGLGAESKILRKWESAVSQLAFWGVKWRIFSVSATTFSTFVQQIGAVFVVIVGVYLIAENELTQGALIACVILSGRALAPLAQVSGLLVQYHQSKLALESLEEIVEKPQERPEGRKFVERVSFEGAIEFRDVVFNYPGESQTSLQQLSFKIKAGEKVAILGRIGSGKSTIHKLLMGLYQPLSGAVFVDDIDISQIDPAQLRSNIGYVPQDSILFYGNIRENIAYHHNLVSDEEIIRVADLSGVGEFVNQHPQGFERMIGERGEYLSGGQRQSISIARALVDKPPIMLMDEPSTAIDNASEARLIQKLKEEFLGRTLILVTHKTSMLSLIDRVIVVERGKLLADGPKDKVLDALKKGQLRVS